MDLVALPKVHLHVHLESAVRWPTLHDIARANGCPVPPRPPVEVPAFSGFREFGDHGSLVRDCLQRPEDFYRVAVEFCEDQVAQGVRYAEVTFTAASHGERLGQPDMPIEAALDGLTEGAARTGLHVRMLLDHSRRRSVERAWQTVRLARRYADRGVVGIGMAGQDEYPLAPFAQVITAAADAGLHLVHHAGESAGPHSVREAVTLGRAERIGHGVTVIDDPELMDLLRDKGIAVEACPSSNVALRMVAAFAEHPMDRLRRAGVAVTLNADIPSILHATLVDEYARVRDAFGYSPRDLADLAQAGIDASFAPAGLKRQLTADVSGWLTVTTAAA